MIPFPRSLRSPRLLGPSRASQVLPALMAAVLGLGNTCGGTTTPAETEDPGSGGDVAPAPSLAEPLTDTARAGVITDSSELITGPLAKGQLGDIRIYNGHVAFVIEGIGPSDGYNPWGGGILDAALVAGDGSGKTSPTWFGELLAGVNILGIDPDSVEVLNDGSDGEAAVVRAIGQGRPFEMIGELLDPELMEGPMWLEYSLAPDSDALSMTVGFENGDDSPVDVTHVEIGFMMGDGARPYTPGGGFDLGNIEPAFEWYGAFADDVGYQIEWDTGPITQLMSIIGVVISYVPGATLAPGDVLERTFDIRVVPPGRSPPTGESVVQAQVKTAKGDPAAGRLIEAFVKGRHVGFAVADADGKASLSLPEGTVLLKVDGTEGDGNVVTLPPAGELRFVVKDGEGEPIPARVEVRDAESGARIERIFAPHGEGTLELVAGGYEVIVGRGFEYTVFTEQLTISEDSAEEINVTLERVVDTTGWVSSDFHLHAQGSPDSSDSYEYKVSALAAEGVEVSVSTDHDNITDWQPAVVSLGLEKHVRMIMGEEITTYAYGHFNVFPLVADPSARNNGAFRWFKLEPDVMLAGVREGAPAGHVIQINHPRTTTFGGYMAAVGFDPVKGTFRRPDRLTFQFDAMEVTNGKRGASAVESDGFRDWVGMLAHGKRVAGTGNSDSHHALTSLVGFPRNYVQVGKDNPADVTGDDLALAVHDLRLSVSAGPFLTAKLTDVVGDIDVRVQAAPWVAVDRVHLVVNGEIVQTVELDDPTGDVVRYEGTLSVEGTEDSFAIIVVEGDEPMDPLYAGRQPFAFTNALFVDADGDGEWTAPGTFDGVPAP